MSHTSQNSPAGPNGPSGAPGSNLLQSIPSQLRVSYEDDEEENSEPMVKPQVRYAPQENTNIVPSIDEKVKYWRIINENDSMFEACISEVKNIPPEIAEILEKENAAQIQSKKKTEEILNILFPKKEWIDDQNSLVLKPVTSMIPSREEPLILKKSFEAKLKEVGVTIEDLKHLKKFVRSGAFDDLIREVMCKCVQRGLLLHRVKEGLLLDLDLYSNAAEGSIDFAMKNSCEMEELLVDMLNERDCFLRDRNRCADVAFSLNRRVEELSNIHAEEKEEQKIHHLMQLQDLEESNRDLEQQIEDILCNDLSEFDEDEFSSESSDF